jgi:hypothetical protein
MEELRAELRSMFQELSQQLLVTVHQQQQQDDELNHQDQPTEETSEAEIHWASIMIDLPSAPVIKEASWPKIFKLAKELKRRAALMTAGRDLHDIHKTLFLVAQWPEFTARSKQLYSTPPTTTVYCSN